jgi:hypothetical protein
MKYVIQLLDGLFYKGDGVFYRDIEKAHRYETYAEAKTTICCYPFKILEFDPDIQIIGFYKR